MKPPYISVGVVLDQHDIDNTSIAFGGSPTRPYTSIHFGPSGEARITATDLTPEQFAAELHNIADRIVLAHAARTNQPEKIIEHALTQVG